MNSDIYCRDFEFLHHGIKLLEAQRTVACVGFSLQYIDGTVQHDGVRFEKAAWFDGLWASEHPGKAMPHNWQRRTHQEVEAVTAALMLLRREDFPDSRLFDPRYIVGDFEDADLCMRLHAEGRAIAIVRTDGLYHLERQSVRRVGDDHSRRATTLLNCILFNKRWSSALDVRDHGAQT